MSKKKFRNQFPQRGLQPRQPLPPASSKPEMPDPSGLAEIPVSFQSLFDYLGQFQKVNLFALRRETFLRIEKLTNVPLITYVTRTRNLSEGMAPYIEDGDLIGFGDLINSVSGDKVDIFLVSNGGSAEATERIVRLLRERFNRIRFIVPANAYSAATMMCLSGDEILMDASGTLGPIDPQINGVPAGAIMRTFETIEKRLKDEGTQVLGAYLPLIQKYDLSILEICRSQLELSTELARSWLSKYMLKCDANDPRVNKIVEFLSSYEIHKSHGRSIDRNMAKDLGIVALNVEDNQALAKLVRSLYNQYDIWFDKSAFYKMFEDSRGNNWGRQVQQVLVQIPKRPQTQPATRR